MSNIFYTVYPHWFIFQCMYGMLLKYAEQASQRLVWTGLHCIQYTYRVRILIWKYIYWTDTTTSHDGEQTIPIADVTTETLETCVILYSHWHEYGSRYPCMGYSKHEHESAGIPKAANYTVSQKRDLYTFAHNFGRCWIRQNVKKFATKWLSHCPPHLKRVATLPCEMTVVTNSHFHIKTMPITLANISQIRQHLPKLREKYRGPFFDSECTLWLLYKYDFHSPSRFYTSTVFRQPVRVST